MLQSKIFGFGISRTGTTLLTQPHEMMKLATKHFIFELYQDRNAKIINEYIGFVDSPMPLIWKNLDKRFLKAKFILKIRTLEQWLESIYHQKCHKSLWG